MDKVINTTLSTCACGRSFLSSASNTRLLVLMQGGQTFRVELCGTCSDKWAVGGKAAAKVESKVIGAVQLAQSVAGWPKRGMGADAS